MWVLLDENFADMAPVRSAGSTTWKDNIYMSTWSTGGGTMPPAVELLPVWFLLEGMVYQPWSGRLPNQLHYPSRYPIGEVVG